MDSPVLPPGNLNYTQLTSKCYVLGKLKLIGYIFDLCNKAT